MKIPDEQMYYPCILDCKSARIIRRVSDAPMTFLDATKFLKDNYRQMWIDCDAIPQRINLAFFHGATNEPNQL
jgi:hypothetical protein